MGADADRIAAARLLLDQLGVTLADLHAAGVDRTPAPSVAEYLPRVAAAAGPGARKTYGSYWQRMAAAWGDRPLDTIQASDVEALQQDLIVGAVFRRNGRDGRHAGEHLIAAARAFFNRAIADRLLAADASPAHQIHKPRRLPSPRRALLAHELEEINLVARTTGNDVILDALLLRLHTETACRRGGALALRLVDLNTAQGLVRLREKGGTMRWQPITLDLAARLADHAGEALGRRSWRRGSRSCSACWRPSASGRPSQRSRGRRSRGGPGGARAAATGESHVTVRRTITGRHGVLTAARTISSAISPPDGLMLIGW